MDDAHNLAYSEPPVAYTYFQMEQGRLINEAIAEERVAGVSNVLEVHAQGHRKSGAIAIFRNSRTLEPLWQLIKTTVIQIVSEALLDISSST
jgi:hypothetical protein